MVFMRILIKNKIMKRVNLILLLSLLFMTSNIMAQLSVTIMKTTKSKGDTIKLQMVAGGNVSIDLGDGIKKDVQVSKDFRRPTIHTFTLPVSNAEIKIHGVTLTYLDCSQNNLITLDVSSNIALRNLRCQSNQLKELNVSNNQALSFLWCMSNRLESLNISNNPELSQLSVANNKLTALDVSNNKKLTSLVVSSNNLGTLDLSNNSALKSLDARNIGISSLDLSANPNLTSVSIDNSGPTNANNFSACALDKLYDSLVIQLGVLYVVNSSYKGAVNNDAGRSNKILASNRGWMVFDRNGDKELLGDGGGCNLVLTHSTKQVAQTKSSVSKTKPTLQSKSVASQKNKQAPNKIIRSKKQMPEPKWVTIYTNKQVYDTKLGSIAIEGNKITQLHNKQTNTSWAIDDIPLFEVDIPGVETELKTTPMADGQVKLKLTLKNTSNKTIYPTPTFPVIKGAHIKGRNSSDLYYLYPRQGYGPTNVEPVTYNELYSAYFPLQFMDVYDEKAGGLYIITNDTSNYAKRYSFSKQGGKIDMKVSYKSKALKPGETWEIPTVIIGIHESDWHQAFFAYKDWIKTWYEPITERKEWFREIFNFRQVFIHPMFGEPGIYNPATKEIDLLSRIEASKEAFGGIDYVHLFDWMKTPLGRILDYDPWGYLGGHENLADQIKLIQNAGLRVGLYFEGYIMNKKSKIGLTHGEKWQQLDQQGKPFTRWGPGNYLPCAFVPEYQNYMSNLVSETSNLLGNNGIYLDQYGFCYQYGCHHSGHNHDSHVTEFKTNLQVLGEAHMAQAVKNKISSDQVLYIEEAPTDVSTQYYDGSFSYAIQKGRPEASHNPAVINMARFALPNFKTIQIIKSDRPLGNDQDGVKHVFFNGEGIWLSGPLNDPNWFSEELRKTIRKTHSILRKYKAAFLSEEAIPLVPVLQKNVYANFFPSRDYNVWTLFNAQKEQVKGNVLKIKHINGSTYFDVWNNRKIEPIIKNGYAVIELVIDGRDAGCVIQSFTAKK